MKSSDTYVVFMVAGPTSHEPEIAYVGPTVEEAVIIADEEKDRLIKKLGWNDKKLSNSRVESINQCIEVMTLDKAVERIIKCEK